jgi:competence protein ComEA
MPLTRSPLFKRLQRLTTTTTQELVVVVLLLAGLSGGAVVRQFWPTTEARVQTNEEEQNEELYRAYDSLARVERSTFTGTTPDAAPVPELAAGDTLVQPAKHFAAARRAKKEKITSGTININTAAKEDLMRLPGVGEATAEKIVAFRQTKKFRRPEDIMQIKGIGAKKFEAMREFLEVR